jgi:hypothetical protein
MTTSDKRTPQHPDPSPPRPAQPQTQHVAPPPDHPPPSHTTEPSKLPPVGHKDYTAGQPIDEEEQKKVESEHDAKIKAGEEQRKAAEAKAHHDPVADKNKDTR